MMELAGKRSLTVRVLACIGLWGASGLLCALCAPYTLEAGESLLDVRLESFAKTPIIASLGLSSLLSAAFDPPKWLGLATLIVFGTLFFLTVITSRRKWFLTLLSLQILLLAASLWQAAQVIVYWNEHGHG